MSMRPSPTLPLTLAAILLLGAGPSASTRVQYEKRLAALKADDPKQVSELAAWCLGVGLKGEGEALYRKLLQSDPDHAAARKALGYVKAGETWLTAAEKKHREEQARLEAEAARIPDADLAGILRVARKAGKAGFPGTAEALFRRLVALDPEHAEARHALRQTRFEGSWQDDAVLAAAYLAAGSDERRAELAAALKASGSEYTPDRLGQCRRWAAQPRGRFHDLPLEGKGYKTDYILDVPETLTGLDPLPLIVYLHGGGNGVVVEPEEVVAFAEAWRSRGWITAMPKCPDQPKVLAWNYDEGEACVMDLVEKVASQYPVDPRRVYLAGSSMGGAGTLWIAARHPERFAAAGALCPWAGHAKAEDFKGLPLFLAHGDKDASCPVEMSRALADGMSRLGLVHRYIEYPGKGHDLGAQDHKDMADWICDFALPPPPPAKDKKP